ncbi:MAG: tryptophan--tRNA ligase [Candidatus Delongbacteria bacterium]|nr:tryptophan--tRNA ligase [Candidatus Delongbacteria bacterium]
MENTEKKTILSGIQPTNNLTLGNYIGAMKNFVNMQDKYQDYTKNYIIVDLHALTVPQVPSELRERTYSMLALYLAVGLDPEKSNIFVQSHITGHTELTWILNTLTGMGQLNRMTQYKDKSAKEGTFINVGLFAYPVLMAADILLYNANLIPIGDDQKQHLELSRDIAEKFNYTYSPTFNIPEAIIPKQGARIMDLQHPENKMSKSAESPKGTIILTEDLNITAKKIKSAVTDSDMEIRYDQSNPEKAGINNLLTIYSTLTDTEISEIEKKYVNSGYGDFKKDLSEIVVETLRPIKEKHDELLKDKKYLDQILKQGAANVQSSAYKLLSKVYKKVGLVAPAR